MGSEQTAATAAVLTVPRLIGGRYNEWRPQMENALMRAGVARRDYAEECADWAVLASTVENWSREEEQESINYALGRSSGTNSASSASVSSGIRPDEKKRRVATEAIARMRKAYTLLYQALPEDLRRLVAGLPQGNAYALWSWLEKKYQNTEQDNIGDLWDSFTRLEQGEDETFEAYKARVDQTFALLEHAKDKPSAGLYAHRVLWKLTPMYAPAVLALKASGKLTDANKIVWSEVVTYISDHERSLNRLAGNTDDGFASGHAAAATRVRFGHRGDSATKAERKDGVKCYNCGELGHIASGCRAGNKNTRRRGIMKGSGQQPDDDEDDRESGGARNEQARSAMKKINRFASLSSDSEDFDHEENQYGFSARLIKSGQCLDDEDDDSGAMRRDGGLTTRKTMSRVLLSDDDDKEEKMKSACLVSSSKEVKSGQQREAVLAVQKKQESAVSTRTDTETESTQLGPSQGLVCSMPLSHRVSSVGGEPSGLLPEHGERFGNGIHHPGNKIRTLQKIRSKGKIGVADSALKEVGSDCHPQWTVVGPRARTHQGGSKKEILKEEGFFALR